jgi:hypothetical protein
MIPGILVFSVHPIGLDQKKSDLGHTTSTWSETISIAYPPMGVSPQAELRVSEGGTMVNPSKAAFSLAQNVGEPLVVRCSGIETGIPSSV